LRQLMCATRAVWCALLVSLAPAAALAATAPAPASPSVGVVAGTVSDSSGTALAAVVVSISGATTASTATGNTGDFSFNDLPPGIYTLSATKGGYNTTTVTDIYVLAGSATTVSVMLTAASFSSIKSLGRTVVTARRGGFNATTASVSVMTPTIFRDQGQLQVARIMDQTPGVVTGHPGTSANDSAPGAITFPNIRGGLSFETASLIDGHPVSVGAFGDYVTTFLNSYLLGDVELVKGPGADAPVINYAIGGTINFRTRDFTSHPYYAADYGIYGYGGQFSNFVASSTVGNKFSYVLDYAINGTQGPVNNSGNFITLSNSVILNGLQQSGFTTSATNNPTNQNNPFNGNATLVACCFPVSTTFDNKNELAKFRYRFSSSTSATVSYLGSQTWTEQNGNHLSQLTTNFAPAAAGNYNGPVQPGPLVTWQNVFFPPGEWEINNEPIFQAEVRSAIHNDSVLIRWYSASINRLQYNGLTNPAESAGSTMNLYGTVNLQPTPSPVSTATPSPPPTLTTFRGQPVTLTIPGAYFEQTEEDKLHGGSFEYDHPDGDNLYTFSYDQTNSTTNAYAIEPGLVITVPAGSYQHFGTYMLRGLFQLNPDTQLMLTNYYSTYMTHSSPNNGVTFSNSNTNRYNVRAGVTWRPASTVSWRGSIGTAIAPPYLALVSAATTTPLANRSNTFATNTINNPNLVPETAFGFDIGQDQSFANGITIFSWDVYSENVRNQFLTAQFSNGTACVPQPPPMPCLTLPLFTTENENVGKGYYGGIEASLRRTPPTGFGYVMQGALLKAIPYGLDPSFYNTTSGPNTTNLAVVQGVNYLSSGNSGSPGGFNSVSNQSIPYSQGYGEINYRGENGYFYSLGTTYYGPNNSYNEPAFFVWNATARWPLNQRGAYFQISVDNLLGAYSNNAIYQFGGVPNPLVNGKLGLTNGNVVGPGVVRMFVHYQVGG